MQLEDGLIDERTFYSHYESLQLESIKNLQDTLAKDAPGLSDGEVLEWASLLFLRHRYWSREVAEEMDVRAALIREDRAIYPWRVEYGQNPIWSFDTVVQPVKSPEKSVRVQLKAGHFKPGTERYRSYLPTMVRQVVSELEGTRLRQLVSNAVGAIKDTYILMHNPDLLMRTVDEESLKTVEKVFEKVG